MMSRNVAETIVGATVLGIAIIFAVFLWRFSDVEFGTGQYTVNASLGQQKVLRLGQMFRLAGVKIGSVSNLSLDPETFQVLLDCL